jgi:uncharacterized membrane protein
VAEKTKSNDNMMGAVAYLLGFVTGIVLLIVEKKSSFVRFHAMQSTILFGGVFILNIVLGIIPVLGWVVALLVSPVLMIVSFILWLVLMWKAYNGEMYKLPYIGELAEKQLAKMK